jgi:hypothetical protein
MNNKNMDVEGNMCLIFLNATPKFDQMAKTMKDSCLGFHRPCDGPIPYPRCSLRYLSSSFTFPGVTTHCGCIFTAR